MTNTEKLEDVIEFTYNLGTPIASTVANTARDIARKLDAVLAECDKWDNQTTDAIRAIAACDGDT